MNRKKTSSAKGLSPELIDRDDTGHVYPVCVAVITGRLNLGPSGDSQPGNFSVTSQRHPNTMLFLAAVDEADPCPRHHAHGRSAGED
jgi:hypothetical protein